MKDVFIEDPEEIRGLNSVGRARRGKEAFCLETVEPRELLPYTSNAKIFRG